MQPSDVIETRIPDTGRDYDDVCDVMKWLREVCHLDVMVDSIEDHPDLLFWVAGPDTVAIGIENGMKIERLSNGFIYFTPSGAMKRRIQRIYQPLAAVKEPEAYSLIARRAESFNEVLATAEPWV